MNSYVNWLMMVDFTVMILALLIFFVWLVIQIVKDIRDV